MKCFGGKMWNSSVKNGMVVIQNIQKPLSFVRFNNKRRIDCCDKLCLVFTGMLKEVRYVSLVKTDVTKFHADTSFVRFYILNHFLFASLKFLLFWESK